MLLDVLQEDPLTESCIVIKWIILKKSKAPILGDGEGRGREGTIFLFSFAIYKILVSTLKIQEN